MKRSALPPGVLAMALVALSGASGCGATPGDDHDARAPDARAEVDAGVVSPWPLQLLAEPPHPDENPTTPEKVELGRLLFYDPITSSDGETACATCHSEIWGMSDALPRSVGNGGTLQAGPGRTGPNVVRRNSQTLWNVAYRTELFWDGRSRSLEEQALLPFGEPAELNRDPTDVAAALSGIPEYVALFAAAFPADAAPVRPVRIAGALAAFQRTLVSDSSLYDSYVKGDLGAMSDDMVRGMFLFAEAKCASCHSPPRFESEAFANRGVPSLPDVEDLGRFEVTEREDERGAFRVPTLRNVRETGPYFHTGAVATLLEAVTHEVREAEVRDGARAMDDAEIDAIFLFVSKGLVDRSADPHRPERVPSGLPVPIDDTRILR